MLGFFTKSEYIIDLLNGFIDIHNHILPGIDDGAKNIEESLALINGFSEFGVTNFICTPHIMHNYYDNTPKTIKKSFKKLKKALKKEKNTSVVIKYGAEHMIDDNFENLLEKGKVLPLKNKSLLIEMSYLQPSINFNNSLSLISAENYFPILAHPERYVFLNGDLSNFLKYKNKGIQFQLNLLSLSNYYGTGIQKSAIKLLENGLIDFLASDVHNLNQLKKIKELKISKKTRNLILPVIDKTIESF